MKLIDNMFKREFKIVQFDDGTYGVVRVERFLWFKTEEFASSTGNYWWESPESVSAFCKLKTLDAAKVLLERFTAPKKVKTKIQYTEVSE